MLLIGVQPVELEDYGGSLRPAVRARIPEALEIAADYLHGFGHVLRENTTRLGQQVITPGLELESYESGRPDERAAFRLGDARVLERTRES